MAAIALAPGLLAGVFLAFNGRLLLGSGVLALFVSMQLYANHVQITYYTLLLIGLFYLAQLVDAFRHKTFGNWGKAVVATGSPWPSDLARNLLRMWPTYEYSKETIRGGSELFGGCPTKAAVLDKDYLFGWS